MYRLLSVGFRVIVKSIFRALPHSERVIWLASLPKLRRWEKAHRIGQQFPDRTSMHEYFQSTFEWEKIDFFEFGVFRGDTLLKWAATNKNPSSRFFGFDTFTGLPEDWQEFSRTVPKGAFDLGGKAPEISDSRVHLIKGLFQDTLSDFLKNHLKTDHLIVHIDADLYNSTLLVLSEMAQHMVPGTIVIFDEFNSVLHEFRALDDFVGAYRREYEVLGVTLGLRQIAIRFVS